MDDLAQRIYPAWTTCSAANVVGLIGFVPYVLLSPRNGIDGPLLLILAILVVGTAAADTD